MNGEQSTIRIGAHRGAMCHAPENTIAAFEKAIEFGTYRIECDIRRTQDGHLVMMHDATVDRTTNGTGALAQMTLEDVHRLRSGETESVPTLGQTLACARGRCRLLLELKDVDIAEAVVETVLAADMLEACTLISFDEDSLKKARQTDERVQIGFFHLEAKPIDTARIVDEFGARLLVVWPRAAAPDVIASARAAGLYVRCGFADSMTYDESKQVFTQMVEMGVQEISCGRPDWIARMIEEVAPA